MPRLLLFAPCDNVLINRAGESASLIVLFTEVNYGVPPKEMPEGTMVPMRWFIFSQWEMLSEDVGVTFEQSARIINEQGKQILAVEQEFVGEKDKIHHRVVIGLPGFPISPTAGPYRITLSLRKKGDPDWDERGNYPLMVKHMDPNSALQLHI